MIVLGVDPGLSGALVLVDKTAARPSVQAWDMPVLRLTVSGKQRTRLDLAALNDLIAYLALQADCAVVEDLSGRPSTVAGKDGKRIAQKGLWEQGWNCCAPVAALVAAGVPYRMVAPNIWKKRLGVPSDKDGARLAADRLFPEARELWSLKKHDGRAEGALLAEYHFATEGR